MARAGRSVWPWILTGLAILLLFAVLGVGVFSLLFGAPGANGRVMLEDEEDEQGVFVAIPVEGVIVDAAIGGPNPVKWVESCLDRAAKEENLRGILLRVNSPGGGIRASAEILRHLREFRAEHDVPMVVWMKDVAASGGYYVSMASDWIVAHEDTITGSIGVIWNTLNWETMTKEKLGVEFGNLKSAPMKDIGSPNRRMTEKERALIQRFVDDAFAAFVSIVVEQRKGRGEVGLTEESVRALQSTIVSGRMALREGLVDELGSLDTALAKLRELAGIERADLIEYAKPRTFLDLLLGMKSAPSPLEERLGRLEFLYSEGPPLLALWER